jgi:hypothetical protein
MNSHPGPGGRNEVKQMTIDDFLAHVRKELATDGDKFEGEWAYSVTPEDEVEIMFYNGIFTCSKEEFDELRDKTPEVTWKQYPNDWAHDEIDEVVDYLKARDLVPDPKEFDFESAKQQLKILLSAKPEDAGEGYPEWIQHLPGEELDKLVNGVMLFLDSGGPASGPKTESATDLVDRMLDS